MNISDDESRQEVRNLIRGLNESGSASGGTEKSKKPVKKYKTERQKNTHKATYIMHKSIELKEN